MILPLKKITFKVNFSMLHIKNWCWVLNNWNESKSFHMVLIDLNDFSLLTILAGGTFLVIGLIYKFKPPQTETWYSMQLKTVRRSRETFQEAVRFAAKPIAYAGIFLLLMGLLPIFFLPTKFFTLILATILIISICMILVSVINQHINNLFDDEGRRRDTLR